MRKTVLAIIMAAALAGCGSQTSAAGTSTTATAARAASSKVFTDPLSAPACKSDQLSVSFAQVGQAAGTLAGELVFTNKSSSYCHLQGWPKMVGVVAHTGATITAARVDSILGRPTVTKPAAALVVPGKPVYALFRVPEGVDYGPQCGAPFGYVLVTPPGATSPIKVAPDPAGLSAGLPGCSGLAVTAIVGNLPPPPAASTTTTTLSSVPAGTPACSAANQILVYMANNGAAAGTVFATIEFRNTSNSPCTLEGWPTIDGQQVSGATVTVAHSSNPPLGSSQTGPAPVYLPANGGIAQAQVSVGDNPAGGAAQCPSPLAYFLVTPPGSQAGIGMTRISAYVSNLGAFFPTCTPITVTWVVPYQPI